MSGAVEPQNNEKQATATEFLTSETIITTGVAVVISTTITGFLNRIQFIPDIKAAFSIPDRGINWIWFMLAVNVIIASLFTRRDRSGFITKAFLLALNFLFLTALSYGSMDSVQRGIETGVTGVRRDTH